EVLPVLSVAIQYTLLDYKYANEFVCIATIFLEVMLMSGRLRHLKNRYCSIFQIYELKEKRSK
ncbi:hypothetical protein L9F63_000214, partial [Diploptera punctata]